MKHARRGTGNINNLGSSTATDYVAAFNIYSPYNVHKYFPSSFVQIRACEIEDDSVLQKSIVTVIHLLSTTDRRKLQL